ncbi:MAG: hypothetical protein A3G20_07620 [Acidobacteria bacterium RIFCSPLOWO2_12_FULL_59_11]|nr:MAG: hypothetical protein A3G20_07620 [Acidobacteria bacterium RIFCSPLOWO2_12_FULL_59_11]
MRFTFAILLLLAGLQVTAHAQTGQIQVVIIAVKEPQSPGAPATVLNQSISEASGEIRQFFSSRYRGSVRFHELMTPEATTVDRLRDFLREDLRVFADKTLTFIFYLSHGFVHQGEYLLATSSSDAKNLAKLRSTSIGFDVDLLPWLENYTSGSTVLLFVDACASGVTSRPSRRPLFAPELPGVNLLALAATMGDVPTYRAAFSRGLVAAWKEASRTINDPTSAADSRQRCSDTEGFLDSLHPHIASFLPEGTLDTFEGWPTAIVKYAGSVCLDSIGTEDRLLFVYNPYRENRIAEITSVQAGKDSSNSKINLSNRPFIVRRLPAGKFIVDIKELPRGISGQPKPAVSSFASRHEIDLEANAAVLVFPDGVPTDRVTAQLYETGAVYLERLRGPSSEVNSFLDKALTLYGLADAKSEVTRLARVVEDRNPASQILAAVRNPMILDNLLRQLQEQLAKDATATHTIQRYLAASMSAGRLYESSMKLKRVIEATDSTGVRLAIGNYAYFAFLGARHPEEAASLRQYVRMQDSDMIIQNTVRAWTPVSAYKPFLWADAKNPIFFSLHAIGFWTDRKVGRLVTCVADTSDTCFVAEEPGRFEYYGSAKLPGSENLSWTPDSENSIWIHKDSPTSAVQGWTISDWMGQWVSIVEAEPESWYIPVR